VPANVINTLTNPASQGFGVETGGNLGLSEESADTLTLGFVLTPEFLPGLSVAIDYYKIDLEDAISEVAFQALVNSCFQTLNINSVACQSITRLPTGNIDVVRAPLLNVAERTVEGMDVQLNYALDSTPAWLGGGATLDFAAIGSWQFENSTVAFEGQPSVDCAGYYGGTCSSDNIRLAPGFRALLRTNWRNGPLRITPEVRYIGNLKLSPTSGPNENNTVSSWVYFDLTAGYEITDRIQVYGGMTNVFDKQPPVLGFNAGGDSNTNVQLYDTIGRSYFIGASVGFGPR
jgi:iron complex outermembrane recepter protein